MKKVGYISISIIICIILLFTFKINRNKTPYTYYQVYLDGEVLGNIKSKEKLEKYINEQGILIKNQVIDYQNMIETTTEMDKLLSAKTFNEEINIKINELNNLKNVYKELSLNVDTKGNYITSKDEVENILSSLDQEIFKVNLNENKIEKYDDLVDKIDIQIKLINEEIFNSINEIFKSDKEFLNESEEYYLKQYLEKQYYNVNYSKMDYINDYIEEYKIYTYIDNVYKPLGINIQKINSFKDDVITEKEAYEKIIALKPCTIEGYQFRIKRQDDRTIDENSMFGILGNTDYNKVKKTVSNDIIIYVTDKEIFEEAMDTYVEVFIGSEQYEKYKTDTQDEITSTGTILEDIYVEQDITIKKTNISVKEKIYTNAKDLSSYLLYGDNTSISTAYASATDTISSFVLRNQISVEEFFLFNREFTSINNMFYEGQPITIAKLNPQVSLAVEEHTVVDKETKYETVERYNSSLSFGSRVVVQQGQNGVERVTQNVKKVNGAITYIEPISKETVVGTTNEIVEIGTKVIPHVGSTGSWGWPTNPGYTFSSYFGYRLAVFGEGDFHSGLDIAGLPIGSPVYAANNGTVITRTYTYSYGNYIMIDHNNGFYTVYAHMNGFAPNISTGSVVSRGQVIGYIGQSGWATGPHLHYEIRVCSRYSCVVNPLNYY